MAGAFLGAIDTTVMRVGFRDATYPEGPPSWTSGAFSGPETDYRRGRVGNSRRRSLRGPWSVIESGIDVRPPPSQGATRGPKMAADSVRLRPAQPPVGKDVRLPVQGREVMADTTRAVTETPTADFAISNLVRPINFMSARTH